MKIAVLGSKNFDDYTIFLRAMRTALYSMDEADREIELYPVGRRVGQFAIGFANTTEDSLRGRGIKISCRKRPHEWLASNMHDMDYFAFFKKPGEPTSKLVDLADDNNVEAQIYEFK